jgi:hypothetical protein
MKPIVLSLHPTMQCSYNCNGCYLKKDIDNREEKSKVFFINLIKIAKNIGIKEIALAVNYFKDNDKNIEYFKLIQDECKKLDLIFTVNCNYECIEKFYDIIDSINMVNVSFNPNINKNEIELLRKKVKIVNCNILLSKDIVKKLKDGLAEQLLEYMDYLVLLYNIPLKISKKEAIELALELKPLLTMVNHRIIFDKCIERELGLTNGICSRHEMIYINPYGDIKNCYYDTETLSRLDKAEDLINIYNQQYPQQEIKTCPLLSGR